MDDQCRGRKIFEAAQKMRKFKLNENLGIMPQSELFTLNTLIELSDSQDNGELGISTSDIAKSLYITSPAVSRTLGILEQKGYIIRQVNELDRRNTYITITEKGRCDLKKSVIIISDFMKRVFLYLDDNEVDTFILLFDKIHEGMAKEIENIKSTKKNSSEGNIDVKNS